MAIADLTYELHEHVAVARRCKHSAPKHQQVSDRVLRVLLHYLYGQCLPQSITVDALNACREAVGRVDGFEKFLEMSDLYRRNSALCQSKSLFAILPSRGVKEFP